MRNLQHKLARKIFPFKNIHALQQHCSSQLFKITQIKKKNQMQSNGKDLSVYSGIVFHLTSWPPRISASVARKITPKSKVTCVLRVKAGRHTQMRWKWFEMYIWCIPKHFFSGQRMCAQISSASLPIFTLTITFLSSSWKHASWELNSKTHKGFDMTTRLLC